ncbi:MAG: carbohydrate-binding protein [Polyangiaceae bacterium]|nr:carbohydrate-binding protein [Polyangiaceae bacterium]
MSVANRMMRAGALTCVFATIGCGSGDYTKGADDRALQEDTVLAAVLGTYQAESAARKSGCSVDTQNRGFTGSGYVNYGENGTWIEWNNVNVASAGNYTLTFRYAVGSGSRQCAVLINGANAGNVPFSATGSWTTWKTVSITKPLKAGNNIIRVLANTSSGGPNLDKMELSNVSNNSVCPPGQQCFLVPDAYGGSWKDVEKSPNTSHDNLFCWVAGPANILDWSGWGRVGSLYSTDDIFRYAQKYWPPNNDDGPYDDGDDAYDFLEWFFVGDQSDTDYPPGGRYHPSIGSFPSYCNQDMSKPYVGLCPSQMASDSKAIVKLLKAGFAAAIQLKGDVGGNDGGHVITLWGYSFDPSRPDSMTGVLLTDSDDNKTQTNPPDRLFHRRAYWDGVWHIRKEDGSPYKYIKYVYGLRRK